MALQKQLIMQSGVILDQSYHRIMDVRMNRDMIDGTDTDTAMAQVAIFKDSTAREEFKPPVQYLNFILPDGSYGEWMSIPVLDQTNINPIKNLYEYMKTQTNLEGIDYTDSTDV